MIAPALFAIVALWAWGETDCSADAADQARALALGAWAWGLTWQVLP